MFAGWELERLGLAEYFDGIYLSSDYGVKKPDRRFFQALLRERNIAPETAVMVGNDGLCDVRGGRDAGMDTIYIRSNLSPDEPTPEADYVLEMLGGQALAFPVAFDWEPIAGKEARTDGLDGETMTRCAAAFCKRIQDGGYQPAVYFNQTQGYLHYDLRELTDYSLWLAELGDSLHGDEENVCKVISLAIYSMAQDAEEQTRRQPEEAKRATALCLSGAALLVILLI